MIGHVLPALLHKFHDAKVANRDEVFVWGRGTPLREFLHVDDLAKAVVFCLDNYDEYEHINCGAGYETSILDLAKLVGRVVGYRGRIAFDTTKPDGTPRKLMDPSRIMSMGWKPEISLEDGVADAYQWFLQHKASQPPMAS